MDKKEYLEQLNASVRPNKKPMGGKFSFVSSKAFKIILGLLGAMVVFIIIGVIISNSKDSLQKRVIDLKLHLDNTATIISDYQPSVKSSEIRSNSASLSSVLNSTNSELTNYILEKWKIKKFDKKLQEEAALEKDKIESDLFTAKINGILDRIYNHKMSYEISLILNEESAILKATKDEKLKNILTTSSSSLENLSIKFNDFSEGN